MKSWAIVVGINTYAPEAGPTLQGAAADAWDFADWVLDPNGGAVSEDRLYFWTYPWPTAPTGHLKRYLECQQELAGGPPTTPPYWDSDSQGHLYPDRTRAPTAWEIGSTIDRVGRTARAQALEDLDDETLRVYVFFAGHGIRAKNFNRYEETCFLAGNFQIASGTLAKGLVPCESLRRSLLANRFDEVFIFTDCCRSTTTRSELTAQPVSDIGEPKVAQFSIAYAAQDDKPAYEITHPAENVMRGAFSSALMRGLRTYRVGASNALHAVPLKRYVLDSIKEFTDKDQIPSMTFHPDDGIGPHIVSGPPAAPYAVGRLLNVGALALGTKLVLHGGNNERIPGIGPFFVTGAELQLPSLPRGLYLVRIGDDPDRITMFQVPGAGVVHVS